MRRFRTIADGLAQGSDNFLLLRFLAAAAVIYGHSPSINGSGPQDLFLRLNWGRYSGQIAVDLFFVISGFLVSASWLRREHLIDFVRARALRIVPAYAVCVLACAFAVGPIFTTLPLAEYFSDPQTWDYALTNLHFGPHLAWLLPGVFADHPVTIVNGSIWTLPVEVLMYVCVALLGVVGILARRMWLMAVLAVGFVLVVVWVQPIVSATLSDCLCMAALFALGGICYVWRARIPNSGAVLLVLVALAWLARSTPAYAYLFTLAETAFVFWFAYGLGSTGSRLRGFNRFGDYSYGLYLWGYPAQQMVVAIAGPQSAFVNAVCGFAIALLLAIASWHIVERPALRWKTR